MKDSGLSRKTNRRLLTKYFLKKALRVCGIALFIAGFSALIWVIIKSGILLAGKIELGILAAMPMIFFSGAFIIEEAKFTFTVYRQETANETSRSALLEELALNDNDSTVRRNAASQVRDAGLAEKLIRSSDDAEVCVNCLPALIRANMKNGSLSTRLGAVINASVCANTLRTRPLCPNCYGSVQYQKTKVQRRIYQDNDYDTSDYDIEDVILDEYACTRCGRASADDFSITLDSLLPKDSQT